MNERLEPTQRILLVGAMALLCIAAAIVFAVRDALKPPPECDDEDGDGQCDDVSAAPSTGNPGVGLIVSNSSAAAGDPSRLVVLAFPRRSSPLERALRTL